MLQGWLLALTGGASDAVHVATSRSLHPVTGATAYAPWYMSYMAKAYAELGQFADARRCIADASPR